MDRMNEFYACLVRRGGTLYCCCYIDYIGIHALLVKVPYVFHLHYSQLMKITFYRYGYGDFLGLKTPNFQSRVIIAMCQNNRDSSLPMHLNSS